MESAHRGARSLLSSLPHLDPSPPPAQGTEPPSWTWGVGRESAGGLGPVGAEGVRAGRPSRSGSLPGLHLSPSAPTWHRPPRQACDSAGQGAVLGDLSRPRRRPLGPQKQPLPARIFGKPEGRACVAGGGAAPSAAALARVGLVPSPGRRRGGSRAAPRADKRGRQHLRRPRRVISTGWERSAF